jgi:hypothetical protein
VHRSKLLFLRALSISSETMDSIGTYLAQAVMQSMREKVFTFFLHAGSWRPREHGVNARIDSAGRNAVSQAHKEAAMNNRMWIMSGAAILGVALLGNSSVSQAQSTFNQTTPPAASQTPAQERGDINTDRKKIREDRKELMEDRRKLGADTKELQKDRKELRDDIKSGASKEEIAKDREEIRQDRQKVHAGREELRKDRKDLRTDRKERHQDRRAAHDK